MRPPLDNTVIFTITTAGYAPFALNLRESMRRVGLGDLVVYTPDRSVEQELSAKGVNCQYYEHGRPAEWSEYGTSGFAVIAASKFIVASDILSAGKNAFFIDCDIVFLKNPTEYLSNIIEKDFPDLVMQFEFPKAHYNTGFWYARPSTEVLKLFREIQDILLADKGKTFVCDQTCFNAIIPKSPTIKVHALNPKLFACGNQFMDVNPGPDQEKIDLVANPFDFEAAYMLHFNYAFGKKEKTAAMRDYNAILYPELLAALDESPSMLSVISAWLFGVERGRRLEKILVGEPFARWPEILAKRLWIKIRQSTLARAR